MKPIRHIDVTYLNIIFLAAIMCFGYGLREVNWFYLVISGVLFSAAFVFEKKKLRCPKCGGNQTLGRMYALKGCKFYHCRHCGEKVFVVKIFEDL